MTSRGFEVGDRVRLTGKFLRNTGQHTGPEGQTIFTVIGFDRDWAIVDQLVDLGYMPEELAADPTLQYRRIAVGNLYKVGTLTERDCP